jgi:hypothetical protein
MEKRALSKAIIGWQSAHFVGGRMSLPITMVEYPHESIAARELDPQFAKSLGRDMQIEVTPCKEIMCVMYLDASEEVNDFTHEFFTNQADAASYQAARQMLEERPVYAITGGHSSRGQWYAHAKYPFNPRYKEVSVLLYVCHNTPANREVIRAIGARDNRHQHKIKTVSMCTKLHNLHRSFVEAVAANPINENAGKAIRTKQKRAQRQAVKEVGTSFRGTYNCNTQTYGQLRSVASKTGRVWYLISKIFLGEVKQQKAGTRIQTPQSCAHFTAMGNINEKKLEELLTRVVDGEILTREFLMLCKQTKAVNRLRACILDILKAKKPHNEECWLRWQKKFPLTCSDDFVRRYVRVVQDLKVKAVIPKDVTDQILKNMAKDSRVQKEASERASKTKTVDVSLICLNFCCCFTF